MDRLRKIFDFSSGVIAALLMGGIVGCLLVIPVNGVDTGTTNFITFTEIAFAFRVTPVVIRAPSHWPIGCPATAKRPKRSTRARPSNCLNG